MGYWFDDLPDDELVTAALLLDCRFMTDAERAVPGYGPYHRFWVPESCGGRGGWGAGYTNKAVCARQYLRYLEKRKAGKPFEPYK